MKDKIIEILDSWGLREQFMEDGFDMLVKELSSLLPKLELSEERIEELTREWYARHILAPKPEEFSFRAGFKAALKELNK